MILNSEYITSILIFLNFVNNSIVYDLSEKKIFFLNFLEFNISPILNISVLFLSLYWFDSSKKKQIFVLERIDSIGNPQIEFGFKIIISLPPNILFVISIFKIKGVLFWKIKGL